MPDLEQFIDKSYDYSDIYRADVTSGIHIHWKCPKCGRKWESEIRHRLKKYDEGFKDSKVICPKHFTENSTSSGHLYLTRIKDITLEQRNEIIVKMDERGISTNVHYKPLPMLTAYKDLGFDIKDYPNAYNLFENEISLPIYSTLSDEEVEYIIENFLDVLNEY